MWDFGIAMSHTPVRERLRDLGAIASCALVLSTLPTSTAHALGAKSIFAAPWEVAKGVQRIVLPAAPATSSGGLIVVKVRIDTAGAVVSARRESGDKGMASVVEPALLGWRYKAFQYAGSATEVETYVSVAYEDSESRYYVQGDHCLLTGPPESAANVVDIKETEKEAPGMRRMVVYPDNDPRWWTRSTDGADNVVVGEPVPVSYTHLSCRFRSVLIRKIRLICGPS